MKVLIFSDFHLHNWSYGSTVVDGMNSRLAAQADVFTQIAKAAEEVDYVVFCGDLFHTHGKIDASVLKVAYEGFSQLTNIYVDVLVGNHDTSDKSMNTHSLHWLGAFGNRIRLFDRVWHDKDLEISFLNYTESKSEIEKFFRMSQPLCFMHQGVAKVPMGSGFLIDEILTQDMIPDHVEHVFTGHYHQHNRVSDKLTVVGSTNQHNWSDEGDKRGWVVYDTETHKIVHYESKAPKFVTYNMTNALRTGRQIQESVNNNFVRVINYDKTHMEDIRKEFTEAGARSVEFVQKKEDTKRLEVSGATGEFHLPTLVAEYEKQKEVDEERSKVGKELMK